MFGQKLVRVDKRFFCNAINQLAVFAVEPHPVRLWSRAEALRHPVKQVKPGVIDYLKKFFHPRLTCQYDTGRIVACRKDLCQASNGSPRFASDKASGPGVLYLEWSSVVCLFA